MLIGITCSFDSWPADEAARERLRNYQLAVEGAGGRAEFLFLENQSVADAERLAAQFDGLLLSGGDDLPPQFYGEAPREGANLELVNPARPMLEMMLCKAFVERAKPILGICYGCQFLHVWAGGRLVQDIALQCPGALQHKGGTRHAIRLTPGGWLEKLLETDEVEVNSFHHQAIEHPGLMSTPDAHAPDGIVEAIVVMRGQVRGVQWHPERDRDSETSQRLFATFLKAFPT